MNNIKISDNFNLREFQCKCGCGTVKLHSELLRRLQAMRDECKRPITINSGYRCSTHNRNVGGATNSQHLAGRAADIRISGYSVSQMVKLAEKYFSKGGIGTGNNFIHVDTRDTVGLPSARFKC